MEGEKTRVAHFLKPYIDNLKRIVTHLKLVFDSFEDSSKVIEVNSLICRRNSVPYTISMGTPESTKAVKQLIFERPIAKAAHHAGTLKMRPFGHAKNFKFLFLTNRKIFVMISRTHTPPTIVAPQCGTPQFFSRSCFAT